MPIYDRPTKCLMADWAKENLKPGQTFSRGDVVRWFEERYPRIKRTTVKMHVDGMSTNNFDKIGIVFERRPGNRVVAMREPEKAAKGAPELARQSSRPCGNWV